MSSKELVLLIDGIRAGVIRRGTSGSELSYSGVYASGGDRTPLSTAFPVSARGTYPSQRVNHWLEGLLPDNPEVRKEWRRRFDIRGNTALAILGSPVGHDCAGSVQFCSTAEADALIAREGDVDWLSQEELIDLVKSLRDARTTWHGPGKSNFGRFSLSGAQAKTAVVLSGGRYGIPTGSEPSTHIIKPTINDQDLPDQALNEHVCLQMASTLGLPAVQTEITCFGPIQSLLIKRFDRFTDAQEQNIRIHLEDMCQALGVHPDYKYQSDGGPSPQKIIQSIRQHSSLPDSDAYRFLDALIYNWIIVGTDAHAKNYSFLLRGGSVRLAPLYDIASALPYEPDWFSANKTNLAMKIGKRYTVAKADRQSAWHDMAVSLGFDGEEVIARAEDMATRLPAALDQALKSLPSEFSGSQVIQTMAGRIDHRASHCAGLSQMVGVPPPPANP